MDFNNILNQVLNVTKETFNDTKNGNSTQDKITKVGGGAAALGLLSMFLGRKGGAGLAKLGSLAALGSLAYQAYQAYQKYQAQNQPAQEALNESAFQLTDQANIILQAMISAAAADGEITEEERQAILQEAGDDVEVQQWLNQAMANPLSAAQIGAKVENNPAIAAQVYLAARVVCKELSRKEIIFLANLAEALHLDEALVEQLEAQAGL